MSIELQIIFKFFLGSNKDIEDAVYLYEYFKDNLDNNMLMDFNKRFKTNKIFSKYIKCNRLKGIRIAKGREFCREIKFY